FRLATTQLATCWPGSQESLPASSASTPRVPVTDIAYSSARPTIVVHIGSVSLFLYTTAGKPSIGPTSLNTGICGFALAYVVLSPSPCAVWKVTTNED